LSNKQEAVKQSLQQLKDSNRYRERTTHGACKAASIASK